MKEIIFPIESEEGTWRAVCTFRRDFFGHSAWWVDLQQLINRRVWFKRKDVWVSVLERWSSREVQSRDHLKTISQLVYDEEIGAVIKSINRQKNI